MFIVFTHHCISYNYIFSSIFFFLIHLVQICLLLEQINNVIKKSSPAHEVELTNVRSVLWSYVSFDRRNESFSASSTTSTFSVKHLITISTFWENNLLADMAAIWPGYTKTTDQIGIAHSG